LFFSFSSFSFPFHIIETCSLSNLIDECLIFLTLNMIDLFLYILFVDVDRFFFIPRASSMHMSCYCLS
jgi:hypothetical protein